MLKKTLFATLALGAALFTAAAVLPALATSRHAAASASAPMAQAPVDAAAPHQRRGAGENEKGKNEGRHKEERKSHD